jgi:hypothetical protein
MKRVVSRIPSASESKTFNGDAAAVRAAQSARGEIEEAPSLLRSASKRPTDVVALTETPRSSVSVAISMAAQWLSALAIERTIGVALMAVQV